MANRDLNSEEKLALEKLIDSANLQAVLMALSEICSEKADHIRANWRDHVTAKTWDSAAGVIGLTVPDRHIQALAL